MSWNFVPTFRIHNIPTLVRLMAWRRPGGKSSSEPLMVIGIDHDTVCAGVVCAATPGTARVGRPSRGRLRPRDGRPTSAVPGVAAQTTTAQTVWVVNFYSTTKTKQKTTINPVTIMTMSAMLNCPGWQRHCDDESVHRYSVRIIDQCDVTIASGSHIDDVTIAKLLTFEIISGAARNERYGFRLSKTMWKFNYKWAVVFCNGEYHQRLNSHPWWQIFQVSR